MKKLFLLTQVVGVGLLLVSVQSSATTEDQRALTKKLVYAGEEDVVQNLSKKIKSEALTTIGQSSVEGQGAQENIEPFSSFIGTKPFSRVSNFSDKSRFVKIKVDAKTASNEIDFWSRQMSEHALFSHLGLEDPDLKDEALQTHLILEKFRKQFNNNPEDLSVMNEILPILQKEREFQINVLKTLDEGKWIGWIFPLFINHVTLELDYFVDKLNGIKYTPQEEVLFWNRINSEHAAFAARLLDPSERALFLKADKLSMKFTGIPKSEREMMIKISLIASKELDAFHKAAQKSEKTIKSIIHPALLAHVIREGERSIQTLQNLGLYKESEKFAQQYAQQVDQYTNEGSEVESE